MYLAPLLSLLRLVKAKNRFNLPVMPIYVYEVVNEDGKVVNDDGTGGERFELQQSMQEKALTEHPETGEQIRRVLLPPNLSTRYTPGDTRTRLDNKNVEKAGFTKYEKDKLTGKYHRVAGKGGPETITRPPGNL
jgi:predicted nucleic acid-binding Zn ribbon protein